MLISRFYEIMNTAKATVDLIDASDYMYEVFNEQTKAAILDKINTALYPFNAELRNYLGIRIVPILSFDYINGSLTCGYELVKECISL